MSLSKFVRLRPQDHKRGHLMARFTYKGRRFIHGRWFKVDASLARELENILQPAGKFADPPLAFDVVANEKEAVALEKREKAARKRGSARNPFTDLRTTDLTAGDAEDDEDEDEDEADEAPPAKRAKPKARTSKARGKSRAS